MRPVTHRKRSGGRGFIMVPESVLRHLECTEKELMDTKPINPLQPLEPKLCNPEYTEKAVRAMSSLPQAKLGDP